MGQWAVYFIRCLWNNWIAVEMALAGKSYLLKWSCRTHQRMMTVCHWRGSLRIRYKVLLLLLLLLLLLMLWIVRWLGWRPVARHPYASTAGRVSGEGVLTRHGDLWLLPTADCRCRSELNCLASFKLLLQGYIILWTLQDLWLESCNLRL